MKGKIILCLNIFLLLPLIFFGQFRNIYLDSDSNNAIKNISFISPKDGYVSFQKWIGYTQDSGHSFSRKYIQYGNVDYNGYFANLTFGFNINGVHIFSKDSILVFGDYGFVPAILSSSDQGNTFKLIYHSTQSLSVLNQGIREMVFPEKSNVGYAVERNRILKTVNRGQSWISVMNDASSDFFDLEFLTNSTGFAISGNKFLKTVNGGSSWQNLAVPPGKMNSISFINETTGWLSIDTYIYYTKDGGSSWQLKNNSEFYGVGGHIKFVNDSTGYIPGGQFFIIKTTDSGKIWEALPKNNNYSYYYYSHDALFFLDSLTMWAGGGHGFLELSTNGGGVTLPAALFNADLASLGTTSTIYLKNYSKPGYQYQWIRNSGQFASSYDASYISDRLSIDTIKLIVRKGGYSDSSQIIIDTRVDQQRCFATFQLQTDTGTVKLSAGYQSSGVKHYWDFGDGKIDSIKSNPVHTYDALGHYIIKHTVYNTIDKCIDSSAVGVTIIRTQNCLVPDFSYTADSFYTNIVTFKPSFDSTKESAINPLISWQFGDGSASGDPNRHKYDSAKYYNVCMTVRNNYTGCVSSICKPVLVNMNTTCNANFLINTYKDFFGFILPQRTIQFNGALHSQKTGKRNTWIINDLDTTSTGNSESVQINFFSEVWDGRFNIAGNGCGYGAVAEICLDSLNKKITHIVYDSISGCTDSFSQVLTVPRRYAPFIEAVPHPLYPYYVSFYAHTGNGASSYPYGSVWRLGGVGLYGGNYDGGTDKLTYTFTYPGRYTVAVAAQSCYDGTREVYYINYDVPVIACPIYPPDFDYFLPDSADTKTLRFWDLSYNHIGDENRSLWYFGDGDSSFQPFPFHTYSTYGAYSVTLKYINPNGCSKESTKIIMVAPPCSISADFSIVRDETVPSRILFTNTSTTLTDPISYTWYFGNGDSSKIKNPVYFYHDSGTYEIKLKSTSNAFCEKWKDTTIVITGIDICNLNAEFTVNIEKNVVFFENLTSPGAAVNEVHWDFGDGATDTSISSLHTFSLGGSYSVCLSVSRDSFCSSSVCGTIFIADFAYRNIEVIPNPVETSSFVLQYIADQDEPIIINILNNTGHTVKSIRQQSVIGLNKFNITVDDLTHGSYIIQISGVSGRKAVVRFIKI